MDLSGVRSFLDTQQKTTIYLISIGNEIWGSVNSFDEAKTSINNIANLVVEHIISKNPSWKASIECCKEDTVKVLAEEAGYLYTSRWLVCEIKYQHCYLWTTQKSTNQQTESKFFSGTKFPINFGDSIMDNDNASFTHVISKRRRRQIIKKY